MAQIKDLAGYDSNPSYRFAKPGDTVVGTLVEDPREVTTTNDEGKQIPQVLFTLSLVREKCVSHKKVKNLDGTTTHEPVDLSDSDVWTVWVPKASRLGKAISDANRSAGAAGNYSIGDLLSVTLTGYGEPFKVGYNPPGLYTAAYKVAAPVSDDPFAGL